MFDSTTVPGTSGAARHRSPRKAALTASLAALLLCGCASSEENPEPEPEPAPAKVKDKAAENDELVSPFDRPGGTSPRAAPSAPRKSAPAGPKAQAPRSFVTGIVEELGAESVVLNKERFPLVTPALTRDVKVGDFIMVRLDTGRVIAVEKMMKPQVTRSSEPPPPPNVGDIILIDRVRGKVLAADKSGVTIRVIEGKRFIGKTRVPLLPTTVINVVEGSGVPRRKKKREVTPEPEPLANGFPADGPLASRVIEVDAKAKEAAKSLRLEAIGGEIKDGVYIISLRLTNDDVRALAKYEVSLDFKEANGYTFGAIKVAKKGELIEAGASRVINITTRPLLLGPCQGVRLVLGQPQFEDAGGS